MRPSSRRVSPFCGFFRRGRNETTPKIMLKLRTILSIGLCSFPGLALIDVEAAPKRLLVVTITTGFRHGPAIDEAEKVLPDLATKSGGDFTFEFLSQPGQRPSAGRAPERKPNMTDEQYKARIAKPYSVFSEHANLVRVAMKPAAAKAATPSTTKAATASTAKTSTQATTAATAAPTAAAKQSN